MYINFNLYPSFLQSQDLFFLCAVKQVNTEINIPDDTLQRFSDNNLIMWIKGKPKEEQRLKIRLSEVGKKLLENLETPDVTEGDIKMAEYLFQIYLSHEDTERVLGNKKAITKYVAVLRNYLDLSLYEFYYLCEFFLSEHVFTKKLENIFMDKNKIRYGDFKHNIDSSILFQFYEQRKQDIESYWTQKIKTDE